MTTNPQLKIIADHLRSSSFLIADGVTPSNEGRGYVLRRIIRRACLQLHKIGTKNVAMYKFVDALIKEMGSAYPELSSAKDTIKETLKSEEEKFRETLEKGLKILEEEISQNQKKKFSGAAAFKLYDTYGFPLDLTQDILKEKSIEVDVKEFEEEMQKQKKRAKENWSGSGEIAEDKIFFELKEKFGETKFIGYESLSCSAKIIAIIENKNAIMLDQTPFYATSGGQRGDDGEIILSSGSSKKVKIFETKKFAGNLFIHFSSEKIEGLKIGDEVIAKVNEESRRARAANHSATHLLHRVLKEVLGKSVSQKGSNIEGNYFTFDFNFNRGLTKDEIEKIEDLVNFKIHENAAAATKVMALEDARTSGAEMLFGEKYDEKVRVVSIGNCVELCGGTHVKAAGDIGIFKIISEKAVAAGVRRIEGATGFSVIKNNREEKIKSENAIENLQKDLLQKNKEIEKLKKEILLSKSQNFSSEKIGNFFFVSHVFENIDAKQLREITSEIKLRKEFLNSHIFLFFSTFEGKVSACAAVSENILDKFDASKLIISVVEKIGGKGGGGKKDLAMGGGVDLLGIGAAIDVMKQSILQTK